MSKSKLKILFENKNFLVVDKPAGISVFGSDYHPKLHSKEKNLDDYLIKNKKTKNYLIVHRLDKDTSGCLIIAKNKITAEFLKQQFQNKQVKKEYVAMVWGWPKNETGIIDLPIARSKNDFRKKQAVAHSFVDNIFRGEERSALTRFKVVNKIEKFGEKFALVKFYPETGRTHQIRVHAKSIGHPIVADHLYGPKGERAEKLEKKIFGPKKKSRQLLHAEAITFLDIETRKLTKIDSGLPKEFMVK